MTIASFARWLTNESPSFTRAVASRDGRSVVAAADRGGIWVFDAHWEPDKRRSGAGPGDAIGASDARADAADGEAGLGFRISPKLRLLGHSSSIAVLEFCALEAEIVDESEDDDENGILSCSQDGDVALWDRYDGRCLANRSSCFPGRPTSAKLTPSGKHIVIGGQTNEVVVLETTTLRTIRVANLFDDWVSAFCVLPSESSQNALIVTATFSNQIHVTLFDDSRSDFAPDIADPYQLELPGWSQAHMVQRSEIDDRIIFVLSKKACSIFELEPNRTILLLCNIPVPEGRSWAGLRHVDHGLVLLWTYNGTAHLYSFGSPPHCVTEASPMELHVAKATKTLDSRQYHTRHTVADFLLPDQDVLPVFPVINDDDDTVCCVLRHTLSDSMDCWALLCFKCIPLKPMDVYLFRWTTHTGVSSRSSGTEPHRLSCAARLQFSDLGPAEDGSSESVITAACLLRNEKLALGYADGRVCVVPLSAMFYSITPVSLAIPDGSELHDAAVTAIYAIQSQQEGDDLLLLGFSDGRVIAASYPGFDSTAVFQGHVEPVVSFFRPPKQVLPRYSTLACSIAEDNSIVLMDLEDPRILLTFSGHEAPIASVAFRPEDGFMCVKTTDHFLYVWSLKSGHLDRIEAGEAAEDILATCDPKSRVATEFDTGGLDYPAEATIAAVPVQCGRPGEGIAMLLLSANVKKLGLDSQRRKRTFPSRPSSINSLIKDRAIESPEIQSYRGASPLPSAPGTPPPATGRQSLAVPDVEVQGRLSPGRTATPSDFGDAEGDSIDETFVHATLSASMSWELEPKMDKLYRDRLGLAKPADRLSLATKGPGGFWSCIAPDTVHGKQEWRLSPHLTASRILNALALSRSLLAADEGMEGFQEEVATIITHYGVLLADIIGTGFCPASLAYLVRFWQDPIPEIQQAARSLFRATVSRWSAKTRTRAVAYWAAKLRARDAESPRAVVVLAALASGDKAGVDPRTCAEVAGALISMAAEGRTAFRVAALELLGRGFTAWEPHISATGLIRYVEQIAGFLPMIPGSGDAGGSAPPQQPASVQQMARQAILSIATSSTPVFVQTLVLDLTHAKSPDERRGCLRLVSVFVSKKPSVLQPHLLRVAEGIIKCLEPTNPQLRESLLPSVTAALHDLVRTYPSVTFHGPTQHLAVGDLDGPVVVFDLKTGGRYQVLEGHEKPVTAVALSPSGRVAASYSGEEGSVLIYYLTTSLFGLLTGVGSGSGIKPIRASKFLAVEKARVGWASCKLEFTSERTLKLTGAGAAHELEF